MAYALIVGSKANAQAQADFEAAVENAGGQTACIGGVAIDGDVCVQAVNASVQPENDENGGHVPQAMRRTKKPKKKK